MRRWLLPIALASLGLIVEGVERPGDDKFGLIEGGETLFGYGYGLTELAAGGSAYALEVSFASDTTDAAGNSATSTNIGPIVAYNGTALEEFADDVAPVGVEIPPGATGAGEGGGFLSLETYTNSVLYSRLLSTGGWAASGDAPVCGLSDSPFADGRTTCTLEDDDVGSNEDIDQNIAHGLSNGQVITYQYWAKGAGETMAVQYGERTGGSCSNPALTLDTHNTSDTWTQYSGSYTLTDATNCTNFLIRFNPAGGTAANLTGGPIYITAIQVFLGQDFEIPAYAETTTSAVTFGDTLLTYDGPDNSTTGTYTVTMTYTPIRADFTASSYLMNWDTDQDWRFLYTSSEVEVMQNPNNSVVGTTGAPAIGTDEIWIGVFNTTDDLYDLSVRGNSGTQDTGVETHPTTFTDFEIGGLNGAFQAPGFYKNVTVLYE